MPKVKILAPQVFKTLSIHDFKNKYKNVFDFVMDKLMPSIDISKVNEIVVKGKVKSGKRRIIQLASLIDKKDQQTVTHIFISSFYRASSADKVQICENQAYLGEDNVIFVSRKTWRTKLIKQLTKYINDSNIKKIIVHHDELDHASGIKSLYADIHKEFNNNNKIIWIRYSASPEECMLSDEFKNKISLGEAKLLHYDPGKNYVGSQYFCEKELIRQAEPFIKIGENENIHLSDQAKEIIQKLKLNLTLPPWTIGKSPSGEDIQYYQHIGIIRLTGGNDKDSENSTLFRKFKALKDTIPELKDCAIYLNHSSMGQSNDHISWDDPDWWYKKIPHNRVVLVFIEHACSRSTEWAVHPWLGVYHTFRSMETPYNTKMQSQERVNLFVPYKNNDHTWFTEIPQIIIYGDIPAFQLSADIISYDKYTAELSSRMGTLKSEWGIPIKGTFNNTILNIFKNNIRIRSNTIKTELKNAIIDYLSNQIQLTRDKNKKTILIAQKTIIEERTLASGIRRVQLGATNLSNYRIDKMKLACKDNLPYGQGEQDIDMFNLDLSLSKINKNSQDNNWPSCDIEEGEFFITYFLSENQHAILHSTSPNSVYSII